MLWWGWLAFNAGSTFGITNNKWAELGHETSYSGSRNSGPTLFSRRWQLSARACCTTLMASVAGGWVALVQSYIMNDKKQVTIIARLLSQSPCPR